MPILPNRSPGRFNLKVTGPARAAQVVPVHSAHTASMIAQASRVPRLSKLSINTRLSAAATARGKGAKR
jgi:hypothetical protein